MYRAIVIAGSIIRAASVFRTKTHYLSNSLKSPARLQEGAVALARRGSTQNIENNPMQSSRRPPQPAVWAENLTRRANQRHNFIIPEFVKRRRAQS